jgi:C4-dicarboxylate transporter DctM subunit
MILVLVCLGLLALFLAGSPVFAILGAIALYGFASHGIDPSTVVIELYRLTREPVFLAIPLFTFAGYMLAESKAPQRLVALAQALIGWLPGGVAIVVLASCAMFTAFTGGSGITIVALGGLVFPILRAEGYSEKFSLGLVTTSGSLGLLFPPSLPIILYGTLSGTSIDSLFRAGIVPGTLLIVAVALLGVRQGARMPRHKFNTGVALRAIRAAGWEIPLPFVVIGGIYAGWFTANEAAAVTAFYTFLVETVIRREVSLRKGVPHVMTESMMLVGAVLMILAVAMGLSGLLIDQEVPQQLFALLQRAGATRWVFLIALNVFLLLVGMVMEIFSALVVVPLIVPVAKQYGIDPVHLGIIFLANLELAYVLPPTGLNVFLASSRFRKPILEVGRAALPFILLLALGTLVITYVPALSLLFVTH